MVDSQRDTKLFEQCCEVLIKFGYTEELLKKMTVKAILETGVSLLSLKELKKIREKLGG